jgi:hypothetical protein
MLKHIILNASRSLHGMGHVFGGFPTIRVLSESFSRFIPPQQTAVAGDSLTFTVPPLEKSGLSLKKKKS